MKDIDRRSTVALGLVTGVASALSFSQSAAAQTYKPTEGKEIAPGVRQVDLTERASRISAYQKVSMRDVVYQPGASDGAPMAMKNDMVCHMTEGELTLSDGAGKEFTAKKGDVWCCGKTVTTEGGKNNGKTVAIMRVIDLLPV
jgi:quercetin dioxygenase-like cupin family protein